MARDKVIPFVRMIDHAANAQTVIEAMRIFGYINEQQYSELNTAWVMMTQQLVVRSDGAETIELARNPEDIPGMIPREY